MIVGALGTVPTDLEKGVETRNKMDEHPNHTIVKNQLEYSEENKRIDVTWTSVKQKQNNKKKIVGWLGFMAYQPCWLLNANSCFYIFVNE